MQTKDSRQNVRNIYARGADDGLWLGLYFCVLFFVCVVALSVSVVNVVALAMIVGVPALVYVFLRRTHVAAHGLTVFSALWMQGIVMFACACLIFGAVSFVYLRWIDPELVQRALNQAIEVYEKQPGAAAAELAEELRILADGRAVLAPLNIAFGWMWLGMFSGSILSMVVAVAVRFRRVSARPDSNNSD